MVKYDLDIAKQIFGKSFQNEEEIITYIQEKGLEDKLVNQFLNKHELLWRQEEVVKDGEKYKEIWEDITDLNMYKERINLCLLGTENISCGYIADVIKDEVGQDIPNEYQSKRQVIFLHGGKNGDGEWKKYIQDVSKIFEKLTIETIGGFKKAYLIDWTVDVADDVWYMWIGVKE